MMKRRIRLPVGEQRRLIDGADHDLRAVDAEFVGAAEPVEEDVADAVAAAENRLRSDACRRSRGAAPKSL